MDRNVVNSIEDLKHYTNDSYINNQVANIPYKYDLQLHKKYETNIHTHEDYSAISIIKNRLTYMCSNLPYMVNQKRHTFIDTLDNLVKSEEVEPFLLFINLEFVKWSEILVIKDCKETYLLLPERIQENFIHHCINIPQLVEYSEDGIINHNTLFAFNSETNLIETDSDKKCITIDLKNAGFIDYEWFIIEDPNKIQSTITSSGRKLIKENIILFDNGRLEPFYNVDILGCNLFKLNNKLPIINPNTKLTCRVFQYNSENIVKDNITKIPNLEYIYNGIKNNTLPKELKTLIDSDFNFNYSRRKSYDENVFNSLQYVMKYNSGLLNNIYKDKSKIISHTYTGEYILKAQDNRGFVEMSRRTNHDFSSHVVIFVNGELFKGYNNLHYKNSRFIFPVLDIQSEDIVEILYFTDIDNSTHQLIFNYEGDDIYFLNSCHKLEDMNVFTSNVETHEFNIERNDNIQYEIECVKERLSDTEVKIYPKNSFYYNKRLSLVSSRQFRYMNTIVKQDCVDVKLPDYFRFCNDKSKYLVFINGRRIDNKHVKITLTKETRPFDDISVYCNIPLNKNDKLEVLYVPDVLEQVYTGDVLTNSNYIVVDKSKINYNLSDDIFFIFVNGKKINKEQVKEISQNRIMIKSNIHTTNNVTIIKHIPDTELLSILFNQDTDLISEMIDKVNDPQLDELFNAVDITNNEKDYTDAEIPMRSVMYKLVKDYYLRPYIHNGEEFIYDFDDEDFEKDENGNIVLPSDASLEDKIEL